MIPIRIKMTIGATRPYYDFSGSHPTIASIYNSAFARPSRRSRPA